MLGLDVNDTKEIKIQDAIFTLKVIPYGVKVKLMSTSIAMSGDLKERQITAQEAEEMLQGQLNFVKYGIKDHKGIVKKDGSSIVCKFNEDGSLHEDTLNLYLALGIVPKLFEEITGFNIVSEDEQKNS